MPSWGSSAISQPSRLAQKRGETERVVRIDAERDEMTSQSALHLRSDDSKPADRTRPPRHRER